MAVAAICLSSAAVAVFGNALNLSIVWHGRTIPESRRTLVNRLIANHCLITSFVATLALAFNAARSFFGPVGDSFCDVYASVHWALLEMTIVNADLLIVFRYLYICRFKNVGVLDDDFLHPILTALVVGNSAYRGALSVEFGLTRNWIRWQVCTGRYEEFDLPINSATFMRIHAVPSVVLHLALYARIFRQERFLESVATTRGNLNTADNVTQKSLVGLGTSVAAFAAVIIGNMSVALILKG